MDGICKRDLAQFKGSKIFFRIIVMDAINCEAIILQDANKQNIDLTNCVPKKVSLLKIYILSLNV